MRRLLLFLLFLIPTLASAQGYNVQDNVTGPTGQPVGNATITVCVAGAAGLPCTSLAAIYGANTPTGTDSTLMAVKQNPFQTDGKGNYAFSVPAGNFRYTVTRSGITSYKVDLTAPCAPNSVTLGCGGGSTPATSTIIDVTNYGIRPLIPAAFSTITVTTSAASPTVTTTGVSNFIVNDGITIPGAGLPTTQTTPAAPTVAVAGATGSKTISYKCVGLDAQWGKTAASPAGTTTTAPTVFGIPAVGITSVVRASNVTTVTTTTPMFASSGSYHAVIGNVTGGTTEFSGLAAVTITSSTTLTFSNPGSNESGTVGGTSYVLFENAFIVTSVQRTKGSNQLVLMTDTTHNITATNVGNRQTKVFVDGIDFPDVEPRLYGEGLFPVVAVTSNTITIDTPFVAPTTTTSTMPAIINASGVFQTSATVWADIIVGCPTLDGNTKFYEVYADYGSGYSPIGPTHWDGNQGNGLNYFEDYGPGMTKVNYSPPAAMGLPTTPPVSAQNQVFSGQIASISGSTLTLTGNVPTAVTSVTAYHDNGVAFQRAIADSCINQPGDMYYNGWGYKTVYFPTNTPSVMGVPYFYFTAPVNLNQHCATVRVRQAGPIWTDGTLYAEGSNFLDWQSPTDITGTESSDNSVGTYSNILGKASPLLEITGRGHVHAMGFTTLSNGQDGLLINTGQNDTYDHLYLSADCEGCLTSMPLVIENINFAFHLSDLFFSGFHNFKYPIPLGGGNVDRGQVPWWPVPNIEILGPTLPTSFLLDGTSYAQFRGMRLNLLYGSLGPVQKFEIKRIKTFQDPWQPFFTIDGGGFAMTHMSVSEIQMDSVPMPDLAFMLTSPLNFTSDEIGTTSAENTPSMTGEPVGFAHQQLAYEPQIQNTNGIFENGKDQKYTVCNATAVCGDLFAGQLPSAPQAIGPVAGTTGTGACGTITTNTGGAWAGTFKCTGSTGAATIVITPGTTAPHGWNCVNTQDQTTTADAIAQTANNTTTCTLGAAAIASNDVIVFSAVPF